MQPSLQPSLGVGRRFVAGCCAASAISLIAGLFLVPNVARVKTLDCVEGEVCLPKETLGTLWQDLPLLLAYLTLAALCWVVLASLCIGGILLFSRLDLPRWLRLTYRAGGAALTVLLVVDALYLVWGLQPWWGALLALVGLCLLALASVGMRRTSRPVAVMASEGLP